MAHFLKKAALIWLVDSVIQSIIKLKQIDCKLIINYLNFKFWHLRNNCKNRKFKKNVYKKWRAGDNDIEVIVEINRVYHSIRKEINDSLQ